MSKFCLGIASNDLVVVCFLEEVLSLFWSTLLIDRDLNKRQLCSEPDYDPDSQGTCSRGDRTVQVR
jgi:hypothetical protein